jgi:transcriptional regulator with XRE-family HTH domain
MSTRTCNLTDMEYPAETATTAAVAARVKQLRKNARLSGAALAERMAELGFRWNQSTVAKLEAGRRRAITVDELKALAVVLDIPLVWLMADPKSETPVPIARGIEVDPWTALLWMIGEDRLPNIPWRLDGEWSEAVTALRIVRQVANDLANYHLNAMISMEDDVRDTQHQHILIGLRSHLDQLLAKQYPLPPLPDDVRRRARELRVSLPPEDRTADDAEEHGHLVQFTVVPRRDHPLRQQPTQEA